MWCREGPGWRGLIPSAVQFLSSAFNGLGVGRLPLCFAILDVEGACRHHGRPSDPPILELVTVRNVC